MQFLSISLLTCTCWLLAPFLDFFNVSQATNDTEFTIVIDPGHGGKDGGCLGAPVNEKEIVLDISLQFGEMLKNAYPKLKILYTRDTDKFIALHKRTELANSQNADLFVSIHCNSLPQAKQVGGSETYVLGISNARANLEVAKRENAAIFLEDDFQSNYEGLDPNSDEGHILLSMVQHQHLEQSLNFAAKVENAIGAQGHIRSRGVKQAGFQVLKRATMPAVLVETGYLTHTEDNEFLQSEAGKTAMAEALFEAFADYLNEQRGIIKPKPALAAAPQPFRSMPSTAEETAPVVQPAIQPAIQPKIAEVENISEEPLTYHLQLAASKKLINTKSGVWGKAPLIVEVKKEGELYKYLSPSTHSMAEVTSWKKRFIDAGFTDLFIVAYKAGKRVKILK